MSRQIDVNDPSSWDDADKDYLRERADMVPPEHRHHLDLAVTIAPALLAENVESDRLRRFLEVNFPEELAKADDTPVGVAIRILSEAFETTDPDEDDVVDGGDDSAEVRAKSDSYDQWKVAELSAEVDKRNNAGENITPASDRKADLITALRASDMAKL